MSDPSLCSGGLTISFWIRVNINDSALQESVYVISSGGQTTKARGIALVFMGDHFIFVLSTKNKEWKLEIPEVSQSWFHFAVTWSEENDLLVYIDGLISGSTSSIRVNRPRDSFTKVTIGRPNNSEKLKYRMALRMDNLAVWEKALSPYEISILQKLGK